MENVIKILMKRDGNTRAEAKDRVMEVKKLLLNCKSCSDADDIMADMLGLEPDYIMDILDL